MNAPHGSDPNQQSSPSGHEPGGEQEPLFTLPQDGKPDTGKHPGKISKRTLAVIGGVTGALAVIVVVVLIVGFWKPGFFVTPKLKIYAVERGVRQILTDDTYGYGAKNVQDINCNNGQDPTVKKGETFGCQVNVDGIKRQLTVTFMDNNGTYQVGRPR